MIKLGDTIKLMRGGELLARLTLDGEQVLSPHDAVEGACEFTPAFEPLRAKFERELELTDTDSEQENEEWADIWDELMEPGMHIESEDGRDRLGILWIHFQDNRAWWWPLYNESGQDQSGEVTPSYIPPNKPWWKFW